MKTKPVKAQQFQKLRKMKCFPHVEKLLSEGAPIDSVLYLIRSEHELPDVSDTTLRTRLAQFRALIAPLAKLQQLDPHAIQAAKKQLAKGVEVDKEFEFLYRAQRKRVVTLIEQESKNGVLNKSTADNMRVAGELLRAIQANRVESGMNTAAGSTRHADLKDVKIPVLKRYGPRIASLLDAPVSRQRVIDFVRQAIALAETQSSAPNPKGGK